MRAPATPLMGLFKEGKAPIREAIASLAQNLPTLVQQRWTPPKPEAPKREEEEKKKLELEKLRKADSSQSLSIIVL